MHSWKENERKKCLQNQQNNPANDYVERTILDFNIERNCICNGAGAAAGWLMNEIIRQMRPFLAPLFLLRLRFKWMNTIIVLFFVDFFPSFIFKLLLSSVRFIILPFIRGIPERSFYFWHLLFRRIYFMVWTSFVEMQLIAFNFHPFTCEHFNDDK